MRQEQEGEKQEHEEHKRESQKHLTNRISEDTRRLGPPFPLQSLVLTQILQFVDLSQENLRGGENLEKDEAK